MKALSLLAAAFLAAACASVQANLQASTASGDDAALTKALDGGADPNMVYPDGATPLTDAVARNHPDSVKLLLDRHADPNKPNGKGAEPIFFATRLEDPRIAIMLLESGAKPDVRLANGETPLTMAIGLKHTAVVDALLAHHADPNLGNAGGTPIEAATYLNLPSVVAALVDHGAKPIGIKGRVGAVLNAAPNGTIFVVSAIPGAPAAEAGIARGDRVISVNDQPVTGLKLADVVGMLRGDAGEAVSVTVSRGAGPERTYRLVRQAVGASSEGAPSSPTAPSADWWK